MVQLNKVNFRLLEDNRSSADGSATELRFIGKGITSIAPDAFSEFKSLRKLYLYDNKISEFPKGLFRHLTELEVIYLGGNSIRTLDSDLFATNRRMKEIYMHQNHIKQLPSDLFRNLPELNILCLSENKLTSFDCAVLRKSRKLEYLFLDFNNLMTMKNFSKLKCWSPNLTVLKLRGNHLHGPHWQALLRSCDRQNIEMFDVDASAAAEDAKEAISMKTTVSLWKKLNQNYKSVKRFFVLMQREIRGR